MDGHNRLEAGVVVDGHPPAAAVVGLLRVGGGRSEQRRRNERGRKEERIPPVADFYRKPEVANRDAGYSRLRI
jgi:hypothetical protein